MDLKFNNVHKLKLHGRYNICSLFITNIQKMKISNRYILGLLSVMLVFSACEKMEPEFFDENYNGAYFNYENSGDFKYELNFGDHTNGMPEEVAVPVKIKLLGYLSDEVRSVSIKTKSIEDYELAEVAIPEVVFAGNEYEKEIEVMVKRPGVENTTTAVCLYLDGSGDLGTGIKGKEEFIIYVTESYEKPELWSGTIFENDYLGQWSKEKHIYLTNLTGDNDFLTKLYSKITEDYKVVDYEALTRLNALAFNDMFKEETGEPVTISFPIIVSDYDKPEYNEPYFWNKYSEHKCHFNNERFLKMNKLGGKLNTTSIESFYATEKDTKKLRDGKRSFHVEDVIAMLEKYREYAAAGYPISEYKDSCWIEMTTKNINYYKNVVQPYWWEDPDNSGTKEIVNYYFGEYSEIKYQYMLKCIIENEGSENFLAAKIFPFVRNMDSGSYSWDQEAGGEEYMKACYRVIKTEYDGASSTIKRQFSFPELDI